MPSHATAQRMSNPSIAFAASRSRSHERLLAVMVSVAAILLATASAAIAGPMDPPEIGEPAPAFELKDVSTGQTHALSDFEGKIVVLTFQSISCPWNFMRESAGYERVFAPMAKNYADDDVVFLAINSNVTESVDELRSYQAKHNLPYPILKDPGHEIADKYAAATTPHVYVIDKDGVLRYRGGVEKVPGSPEQCGEMEEQYLGPVLDALIEGEQLPYTATRSKGCAIRRS